jgi:hypothetical protein
MFVFQKIPSLGSGLMVSQRSHRAGMWPGTMGDDTDTDTTGYDDLSTAAVSATIQSSNTNVATPGFTDGVASVLSQITPSAQVGILNTITNALGITKPATVVYPVGYVAPKSTLPSWLLPAAAAGVVLLLIMNHKK